MPCTLADWPYDPDGGVDALAEERADVGVACQGRDVRVAGLAARCVSGWPR